MRCRQLIPAVLCLGLLSTAAPAAPLTEAQSAAPSRSDSARGAVPVKPAFLSPAAGPLADSNGNRLSDGLERLLADKGRDDPVNVIVTFSGPGTAASAQRAVGAFSVYRQFSLISGFAATMTAGQAIALANAPGVFRVEQDATAYISLQASRLDFGVEALRNAADPVIAGISGAGVKVCVLDTGVQPDNEQFTDGTTSRVVGFQDFTGDYFGVFHTLAYDDHGHGTHVSGSIAGDGFTDPGGDPAIAPLARGVAPGVTLHVMKVLNYQGAGDDSGIIVALEACLNAGADLANLSLGIPGGSDGNDALSQAVNSVVDAGMIVVAAAGNSGDGERTVGSPAAADKAIAVAAVAEHSPSTIAEATSLGVHAAPFSSRGPTLDGRIKPDIAAPGVSVLSAMTNIVSVDPDPFFGGGGPIDLGCGVGCYTILSGTSMASPFVAGTVALLLEADGTLTPAGVRQILSDTAQDRGAPGKDNVFGDGLLDVEAAVRQTAMAAPASVAFPHHVFGTAVAPDNTTVRIPITVVDMTEPLAITVTINGKMTRWGWSPDLDMVLLDANGAPFMVANPLYPWLSSEPTVPASGTSSTCPAGEDCGQVGVQETIHVRPDSLQPGSANFFLEVYPWADRPNNGKGGSFTVGLSNAYFAGPVDGAHDHQLVADAGADATVTDDDGDGFAEVVLDGRASRGMVTDYVWNDMSNAGGAQVADGAVATVTLPVGTTTLSLSVSNGGGDTRTDTVTVTVSAPSSGDGGGKGGGKPCNPKKQVCA